MDRAISQLSDEDAIAVLRSLSEIFEAGQAATPAILREHVEALARCFGAGFAGTPVSDGDLARQALELIADDPEKRRIIATIAQNLPTGRQRFDVTGFLLVTGVVTVMQTYVHITRDKDGRWTVEIRKQPTDKTLLKTLVQKLTGYMSSH